MFTMKRISTAAMAVDLACRGLGEVAVLFYSKPGYCFDNFSAFSVEFDGKTYPTAEHAYQAKKFDFIQADAARIAIAEVIRLAPSAHEAKKLGSHPDVAGLIRTDWDQVKVFIMKMVIRAKWEQHEYVRQELASTKGRLLVEDSSKDGFWGRGPDWTGKNNLGIIWMEIRDESPSS